MFRTGKTLAVSALVVTALAASAGSVAASGPIDADNRHVSSASPRTDQPDRHGATWMSATNRHVSHAPLEADSRHGS